MTQNTKQQLRKEILKFSLQNSIDTKLFDEKIILERILLYIENNFIHNLLHKIKIALYYPQNSEINITKLKDALESMNCDILLPVMQKNTKYLKFTLWSQDLELDPVYSKIYQPKSQDFQIPNILIVPCVGFNKDQYRIGYGQGYYDHTILKLKKQIAFLKTIGVAYSHSMVEKQFQEEYDEAMDIIFTEKNILVK